MEVIEPSGIPAESEDIMKVYYCTTKIDGKIYDIYYEKFSNGAYNLQTKEAREVTDKRYIEWYNRIHK